AAYALNGSFTITLQSSLLSNNCFGNPNCTQNSDFSTRQTGTNTVTITGTNNLIYATSATLPAGVAAVGACPLLGPLRDNGGPTKTHALMSRSPAIDAGNNAAAPAYDQRGAPDARVSGTKADSGSYEVQQGDIVFNSGFDGCL